MSRNACLLLILLMGSSAAYCAFPGVGRNAPRENPATRMDAVTISKARKVTVYYFHNTIRCATCLRMEEYSKFAIYAGFPDELKSGSIEWSVVDMQLPENRHFVEDFRLRMSSLVIVRFKEGKQAEWRNLEKIGDHVGDMTEFVKYVQSNVKAFLNAGSLDRSVEALHALPAGIEHPRDWSQA